MPDGPAPVVVGVDGGEPALKAALWAGALADQSGAPLEIVHAAPYLGHDYSDAASAIRAAAIVEQRESASAILKNLEEAVRVDFRELPITTEAFNDPVDEVLARLSGRARFLVLGCDELTPSGALLMGSTTLTVAARSQCPVVAWRGDARAPTTEPIVVGVDGTRCSDAALATAFELADVLGVALRVVHSWSRLLAIDAAIAPFVVDGAALAGAERRSVTDAVEVLGRRYPKVDATCFMDWAKPSSALLTHMGEAQMVVIGNRGRNVVTNMLLGSTSLNLLHHSTVPVVLCGGGDAHG